MLDPLRTVAVRIRFAGAQEPQTFQLVPSEYERLQADWLAYLGGEETRGGSYSVLDADHSILVSVNFTQIAYTEPGKIY